MLLRRAKQDFPCLLAEWDEDCRKRCCAILVTEWRRLRMRPSNLDAATQLHAKLVGLGCGAEGLPSTVAQGPGGEAAVKGSTERSERLQPGRWAAGAQGSTES
jgi:hypothetical protein